MSFLPSAVVRRAVTAASALAVLAGVAPLIAAAPVAAASPSCASAGIGLSALGGPNFYIDSGSSPSFTASYTGYRVTNSTGAALDDLWVAVSDFTGSDLRLASGQPAAQQITTLGTGSSAPLFWYLSAPTATTAPQGFTVTVYRHNPALPTGAYTPLCTATGGFNQVIGTLSASANKVTGITVNGGTPSLGSLFTVSVTGNTGTLGSGPSDGSDPYSLWMSPAVAATWPPNAFRLVGTNLLISDDGTAAATNHPDVLRVASLGSSARDYTATYTFRAVGFTSSPTQVLPVQEISSGTQVKHTGSYSASLPAIAPPTNTVKVQLHSGTTNLDVGGGRVIYTLTVSGPNGASVDGFVIIPPTGASIVPGTSTFGGTTLADPTGSGATLVYTGPFTITGGSTDLNFALDLPATPGDQITSAAATLGSLQLGTDPTDLTGQSPAIATVNVDTPPITSPATLPVSRTGTASIDLLSRVSDVDGDPLTITDVTGAQHGSTRLSGTTATFTPDGGYTGPDSFTYTVDDGRGGTTQGSVSVDITDLTVQTITFPPLPDQQVGDTTFAEASSDSGLPIAYSSLTADVCTVDASTGLVTAVAAGACTVAADQLGDATTAAAAQVTRTFMITVAPAAQTITFPQLPDQQVGGTIFADASSDSGLPVTYSSLTSDVCTVDATSGAVTALAPGTCTIAADQPGNGTTQPAVQVTQRLSVTEATPPPADQTITFPALPDLKVGHTTTADANSDSGLPITYSSLTSDACTVDAVNGTVTALAAGSCTIAADQPGDATTLPATQVTQSLTVTRVAQTVTVSAPAQVGRLAGTVAVDASSDSGLPVTFAGTTTEVCTVDQAGIVTLLTAGTCRITVTQNGDQTYAPADPQTVSITVTPAAQQITFAPPTQLVTGPASYPLAAVSSAGLPVQLAVTAGAAGCHLDGSRLTVTGTGTCRLTATAVGNDLYAAAEPITRTIHVVAPADDTVSLPATNGQPNPSLIDVLANDPTGLILAGVGPAGHGTTRVASGKIVYTPQITFRGTDSFTYTVTDATGRRAIATATIKVADAPPTAHNAGLAQVAGRTGTVWVPAADLNGDRLTARVIAPPRGVSISASGTLLRITPAASITGRIVLTVVVDDGAGGTTRATVTDVVSPAPVASAHRRLTRSGTHVRWAAAPASGARYVVRVDARKVCSTTATSCDVARLLGPDARVAVTVLGRDGTRSSARNAAPVHGVKVLIATVYFGSGDWTLNSRQQQRLVRIAARVTADGFRVVEVAGYTDSVGSIAYNQLLSHHRTHAVAGILYDATGLRSRQSWHGENDPAASNASTAGKAKNRRVEILAY